MRTSVRASFGPVSKVVVRLQANYCRFLSIHSFYSDVLNSMKPKDHDLTNIHFIKLH